MVYCSDDPCVVGKPHRLKVLQPRDQLDSANAVFVGYPDVSHPVLCYCIVVLCFKYSLTDNLNLTILSLMYYRDFTDLTWTVFV